MKDLLEHLRLYDSAEFNVDEFFFDAEEESSSSNNNIDNYSSRTSRSRSLRSSRRSTTSTTSRRSTMSRSSSWKDLYKRSLKIPIDEPTPVSTKVTIHIKVEEDEDDDVGGSRILLTGRFYPTKTTIGELKEKLSTKVGIPPDQQILTTILSQQGNNEKKKKKKKNLLCKNTMTLFDANIICNNECILEVRRWQ